MKKSFAMALALLMGWLLPMQVQALLQTFLVTFSVTDAGAPSTFAASAGFPILGAPIAGTVYWQAELFGTCTDGTAAAVTGCSFAAANFAPAIGQFDIDGMVIEALGTGLSFAGAGPNPFAFGPTSGSFDCTLVSGCDILTLGVSFTGSGGGDQYSFTDRITLSDTPIGVPEPVSILLLGGAFAALGLSRRRKQV